MEKEWLRAGIGCLGLFIVGILTAVFIYPYFHELGHALMTLIVGGDVLSIQIWPEPNVLCEVTGLSNISKILIGFSGMIFPIILSGLFIRKWFWSWYVRFILKGMGVLSFVLSVVSIYKAEDGNVWMKDDMVRVLECWDYGAESLVAVILFLSLLIIVSIVGEKPIKRFSMKFFV